MARIANKLIQFLKGNRFSVNLVWLMLIFSELPLIGFSQAADDSTHRSNAGQHLKTNIVIGAGSASFAGGMAGLYQLWYKDYPQSAFHFFNDNHEWLQMDKACHAMSAYNIGKLGYEALRWSGAANQTSLWLGGMSGLIFLTTIETFDGFSKEWGFSTGDMLANLAGTSLFIGQQIAWHEQKFSLKWSYHPTSYPNYNPKLLGNSAISRMVKDYNGQTIWMSANIASFAKKSSNFPRWLNVAVGYGAEGMAGASANPAVVDGKAIPAFERKRQFYLSPDIDLSKIQTKSKILKTIFTTFSLLKCPAPAICFTNGRLAFEPLYF